MAQVDGEARLAYRDARDQQLDDARLTGPDRFLHAYERLGVIEEPLTPSWRRRTAFAFLFPAGD